MLTRQDHQAIDAPFQGIVLLLEVIERIKCSSKIKCKSKMYGDGTSHFQAHRLKQLLKELKF